MLYCCVEEEEATATEGRDLEGSCSPRTSRTLLLASMLNGERSGGKAWNNHTTFPPSSRNVNNVQDAEEPAYCRYGLIFQTVASPRTRSLRLQSTYIQDHVRLLLLFHRREAWSWISASALNECSPFLSMAFPREKASSVLRTGCYATAASRFEDVFNTHFDKPTSNSYTTVDNIRSIFQSLKSRIVCLKAQACRERMVVSSSTWC